jgi:GT2 family glycosyltransferase|tara:strand:+ start:15994 stop:16842 length:849 start_codon:yes stop_codon:yes gene_type:complete
MSSDEISKDLLISIVSYGTSKSDISNVISKLSLDETELSYDILIVDNMGSSELSSFCKSINISYVFPGKNLGFGSGHNFASKYYNHSFAYHLILNPDVFIGPDTIQHSLQFLNNNLHASLVSPKLLNSDGSIQNICRLLPSPKSLMKRFFLKLLSLQYINEEDNFNLSNKPISVPSMHGACFFVRAEYFNQINGFDDLYFLYVEDIDLCRKMSALGDIIYLPTCSAIHAHAQGSYKNFSLFKYHLKSFIYYFFKWGLFFDKHRNNVNKKAILGLNNLLNTDS